MCTDKITKFHINETSWSHPLRRFNKHVYTIQKHDKITGIETGSVLRWKAVWTSQYVGIPSGAAKNIHFFDLRVKMSKNLHRSDKLWVGRITNNGGAQFKGFSCNSTHKQNKDNQDQNVWVVIERLEGAVVWTHKVWVKSTLGYRRTRRLKSHRRQQSLKGKRNWADYLFQKQTSKRDTFLGINLE